MKTFITSLIFAVTSLSLPAQVQLQGFEPHEATYRLKHKGEESQLTLLMEPSSASGGWRFAVQGEDHFWEARYTQDLFPLSLLQSGAPGDFKVRTQQEFEPLPSVSSSQMLFSLGVESLFFLLRGYSFGNNRKMEVRFPTSPAREDFKLILYSKGEETLTISNQKIPCYKFELAAEFGGAMGMFSGFFPKSYFWFEKNSPHRLIKFIGSQGDRDERTIEIISYP